jgi:hypothetical protein
VRKLEEIQADIKKTAESITLSEIKESELRSLILELQAYKLIQEIREKQLLS